MSLGSLLSSETQNETDLSEIPDTGQLQRLKNENSRLRADLDRLRVQFEAAAKVNKEVERIHAQNAELTEQLRAAKLAADDLERRFRLSASSYEDRIAEQSRSSAMKTEQAGREARDLRAELSRATAAAADLEQKHKMELDALQRRVQEESSKFDIQKQTIERIVGLARQHFEGQFTSPESLVAFLSSMTTTASHKAKKPELPTPDPEVPVLRSRLAKLKQRLRDQKRKRTQIQAELGAKLQNVASEKAADLKFELSKPGQK
jgi:predicted RNase H-like nuclease (RuvC/YqgF family)